jgi:hypothetical protein
MNKKIVVPIVGLTFLALAVFESGKIYAQTPAKQQTLIDMLSTKFGLKKTDIQSVFADFQKQRQLDMMANFSTKLDQLIKDGKITSAQKDLIVNKRTEIINQKQSSDWQNLTSQQRKDKLTQLRTDLAAWAKSNNIDAQYLRFINASGRGFGYMQK